MDMRKAVGWVLSTLVAITALLAIVGVWGDLRPDVIGQLMVTFFIIGLTTIGLCYVTSVFFKK